MFEKFIHQTPFLRFVLPLILGIIFKIQFPDLHFPFIIIATTTLLLILLLSVTRKTRHYITNQIWGALVSLFIFMLGIILVENKQNNQHDFQNKEYLFIANIIEKPEEKSNSVKTILALQAYKDSIQWIQNESKILCYFEKDSVSTKLQLGDQLLIKTYINDIKHSGNPYAFNYKNYLKYQEIYSQAYIKSESYKKMNEAQIGKLVLFAHNFRELLLNIYQQNHITGDEFAVLSALTLGYKTELTPELKESFSTSGAMHILAVSGLHVGIIFIILGKILFFLERFKYGKYLKTIMIIVILFFYAAITGFSNSVIRASIMFSFISIGNALTRQVNIYNSLSAAAFCILLYNPYSLMNVGFQLSFLAVISIVFFQPKISSLITVQNRALNYIWQLTTVAIAAQIGTLPLTLYYFNQFPIYFILSNILIIPFVGFIIYGAIVFFILSFWPSLSFILSRFVYLLTKLLNANVEFIEKLPYSKLDHIILDKIEVTILFIFILCLSFFILSKQLKYLRLSITCLILISIYSIFNTINKSTECILVAYNIPKSSALNFIDGSTSHLISDLSQPDSSKSIQYNILPLWQNQNVLIYKNEELKIKQGINYYEFKKLRIIQLTNNELLNYSPKNKLTSDYLVLSHNARIEIKDLSNYFNFNKIIFDSSNSYYMVSRWIEECIELNISYHNISDNGAYIKYL